MKLSSGMFLVRLLVVLLLGTFCVSSAGTDAVTPNLSEAERSAFTISRLEAMLFDLQEAINLDIESCDQLVRMAGRFSCSDIPNCCKELKDILDLVKKIRETLVEILCDKLECFEPTDICRACDDLLGILKPLDDKLIEFQKHLREHDTTVCTKITQIAADVAIKNDQTEVKIGSIDEVLSASNNRLCVDLSHLALVLGDGCTQLRSLIARLGSDLASLIDQLIDQTSIELHDQSNRNLSLLSNIGADIINCCRALCAEVAAVQLKLTEQIRHDFGTLDNVLVQSRIDFCAILSCMAIDLSEQIKLCFSQEQLQVAQMADDLCEKLAALTKESSQADNKLCVGISGVDSNFKIERAEIFRALSECQAKINASLCNVIANIDCKISDVTYAMCIKINTFKSALRTSLTQNYNKLDTQLALQAHDLCACLVNFQANLRCCVSEQFVELAATLYAKVCKISAKLAAVEAALCTQKAKTQDQLRKIEANIGNNVCVKISEIELEQTRNHNQIMTQAAVLQGYLSGTVTSKLASLDLRLCKSSSELTSQVSMMQTSLTTLVNEEFARICCNTIARATALCTRIIAANGTLGAKISEQISALSKRIRSGLHEICLVVARTSCSLCQQIESTLDSVEQTNVSVFDDFITQLNDASADIDEKYQSLCDFIINESNPNSLISCFRSDLEKLLDRANNIYISIAFSFVTLTFAFVELERELINVLIDVL
jgi:hypothetical protein